MVADQAAIFARAALPGIKLNAPVAGETVRAGDVALLHANAPLPLKLAPAQRRAPQKSGGAARIFFVTVPRARRCAQDCTGALSWPSSYRIATDVKFDAYC